MSYYYIKLYGDNSKLCNIVLPWGNCEYLQLPVSVYNFTEISQEKTNELFYIFEFFYAHFNDLLVLTLMWLDISIRKIRKNFRKICKVGISKSALSQSEM